MINLMRSSTFRLMVAPGSWGPDEDDMAILDKVVKVVYAADVIFERKGRRRGSTF